METFLGKNIRTVLRAISQLRLGTFVISMESGQWLAGSLMARRRDGDLVCDRYLRVCVFLYTCMKVPTCV